MYWRFFCFKEKTAYELRISDWSSDVCSSDLNVRGRGTQREMRIRQAAVSAISITDGRIGRPSIHGDEALALPTPVGKGGGSEAFLGRCEFGDQMGRRIRETGSGAPGQFGGHKPNQIGRKSCRDRECQDV